LKSSRFLLNVIGGVGVLAITTTFLVISFESLGQEQVSEEELHDRRFGENDRCLALTDEREQGTCWTDLINDMAKYPKQYETYKDEKKRRVWEAGERNNWKDDPCKMNYYEEFSMNDMKSMDPQESSELQECLAKQLLEDTESERQEGCF
jgi:hypothetical protein